MNPLNHWQAIIMIHQKNILHLVLFLNLWFCSSVVVAAAKTDAVVNNYTQEKVTVEFKEVNMRGVVTWVPIGTVGAKHSITLRNITIGSILRAQHNGVIDMFTVRSPPRNAKVVKFNIRTRE